MVRLLTRWRGLSCRKLLLCPSFSEGSLDEAKPASAFPENSLAVAMPAFATRDNLTLFKLRRAFSISAGSPSGTK